MADNLTKKATHFFSVADAKAVKPIEIRASETAIRPVSGYYVPSIKPLSKRLGDAIARIKSKKRLF